MPSIYNAIKEVIVLNKKPDGVQCLVAMVKLLLLAAFVANILIIISATDKNPTSKLASKSTSSSSSVSSSSSYSSQSFESSSLRSSSESTAVSGGDSSNDSKDEPDCHKDNNAPKCKSNERYELCPATLCEPQNCSELGCPVRCPGQTKDGKCPGKPACVCVDGYLRNDNGVCVPKTQCTPVCGANEVYSECVQKTPIAICRHPGCPTPPPCQPGCECKENYQRDTKGTCVSVAPPINCTGPNEYYSCGGACDNVCATLSRENQTSCTIINKKCNEMCYCENGYARDDNNICIPIEKCKKQCSGPNEFYDTCPPSCSPQTCDTIGIILYCPKSTTVCKPVCRCESGYFRNKKGKCIPKKDCPPVCGANEVYSECVQKTPIAICRHSGCPTPPPCQPGCECKENYQRDTKGTCVSVAPPINCTGPNEYYSCGGACDNVCATLSQQNQTNCPIVNIKCNEMCYCESGYARDDNNICIPIEKCKKQCSGPNEFYDTCPPSCSPQTCDSIGKKLYCPISTTVCKPACRCESGYFRNQKGTCIPEKDCPKCDQNEVYDLCPAPCRPRRCDVDDRTIKCGAPPKVGDPECQPGCRCDDGYARTNEGRCVPRDKCPKCLRAHEVYDNCPPSCPPQTCESINERYNCPFESVNKTCEGACRCEPGYYRNKIGECISQDQCQQCSDPNEYYSCGGACDNVCTTLSQQNQTNCPIVNIKCNEMCYCESGYARDDNNTCIPIKECKTAVCGVNEVFSNCIQAVCRAQNCSQNGQPIACPLIAKRYCNQGCVCQENYLRAENGTCVPEDQCGPPKCSGLNEFYDICPPYCAVTTCDGIGKPVDCPPHAAVCRPACVCQSGYYRNDQGDCVLEESCTTVCGANEVYSECVQKTPIAICRRPGCPTPPPCQPGCKCKENYQRDTNGTCVPVSPPINCAGPNEYYSCGGACDNVCATLSQQNQTNCPIVNIKCNEMCYCESGYARDDNNTCIPIKECKTCPEGEVYTTAANCDAEYCPKTRDSHLVCTSTKNCGKPRCTCGFNQHRDRKTNKCIATADCPPFKCDGQNEEYQSCPPVCPGQNCSDYINNSTCPRFRIGIVVPCEPKCRCINNYYRNSQGKCISGSQCKKEQITCTNTTNTTTVAPPTSDCNNDDVRQKFVEGIADWNINFLRDLVKSQNESSVICSPFSVEIPLGELALFTNQSTESYDQLTGLLNLKNNDEISCAFKDLLKSLKSPANVTLDLAAKVYCNELYPLSSKFLQVTNDVFEAQAENVDCSNPAQAAATINKWVEDNTNNLIKDLVSPDMITPLTRLVLVNAIYFKGDWKYKFNPNDTEDRDFHVSNDKTIQVKTMYQENTHFKYGVSEELGCTILQMPYANEDFTCVIYLPDNIDGLYDLLEKLNADSMIKAQNNMLEQKTKVLIPKFELQSSINLKTILQKNNITDIFSTSRSGIDGILEEPEPLFVSAAIQKAKIILNEEGSEAAAANAFIVTTTAAVYPPPVVPVFNADHPFLFFINYKGYTLFFGTFRNLQ